MVEIRRLRPGDEAIARQVTRIFEPPDPDASGEAHLSALLADKHTHVFVALVGAEPVGTARAHELPRLDGPRPKLLLYTLDVAPSHRRQGIGRALIEAVLALARERRCRNVWVVTNQSNTAAMRLYASTGAERPAGDDVVLVWNLD